MDKVDLSTISLGIVCPVGNERESIAAFVKETLAQCEAFGFVVFLAILDGYSVDGTFQILKDLELVAPRLRVIWAEENRCVVDAYIRGYREALQMKCDWILEMDAGFSHLPSDIPKFLEQMSKGYECVFGSRFCAGGRYTNYSWHRFLVSYGGSFLINLLLGTKLSDMTSGFELFKAEVLKDVLDKGICSKGPFFQTEIKVHCRNRYLGEVPIHYSKPSANVSLPILLDALGNLFRLSIDRVRSAFKRPLKGEE